MTSGGYTTYLDAVENAFGFYVDYAQLVKLDGPDTSGKGAEKKYSPGKCNGTGKVRQIGLPDSEHVSTRHVERANLTIRIGLRRYTRLTNAHSKKIENHSHSVAVFFMLYNYCRVPSTIKTASAMASGLMDHVWTMEDVIGLLD